MTEEEKQRARERERGMREWIEMIYGIVFISNISTVFMSLPVEL
jgi:hypothetical protein